MSFEKAPLGCLVAALVSGCAAPDVEAGESSEVRGSLQAIVLVERVDSGLQTHTNVSAKFARVPEASLERGRLPEADRAVLDGILGSRVLLPSQGECATLADLTAADLGIERAVSADAHAPPVDLLDVGDVLVRVHGPPRVHDGALDPRDASAELLLAPRAFPEVGEVVSGVFYTSPDASRPIPAPGTYAVSGTGSSALDPFVIEVASPGPLRDLTIEGALADAESPTAVAPGADVTLGWDASAVGDLIYVDVRGAEPHRCTFLDIGSAVLPGALFEAADAASPDGARTITIHRFAERSEALPTEPQDEAAAAVIRFDLARTVRVVTTPIGAPAPASP